MAGQRYTWIGKRVDKSQRGQLKQIIHNYLERDDPKRGDTTTPHTSLHIFSWLGRHYDHTPPGSDISAGDFTKIQFTITPENKAEQDRYQGNPDKLKEALKNDPYFKHSARWKQAYDYRHYPQDIKIHRTTADMIAGRVLIPARFTIYTAGAFEIAYKNNRDAEKFSWRRVLLAVLSTAILTPLTFGASIPAVLGAIAIAAIGASAGELIHKEYAKAQRIAREASRLQDKAQLLSRREKVATAKRELHYNPALRGLSAYAGQGGYEVGSAGSETYSPALPYNPAKNLIATTTLAPTVAEMIGEATQGRGHYAQAGNAGFMQQIARDIPLAKIARLPSDRALIETRNARFGQDLLEAIDLCKDFTASRGDCDFNEWLQGFYTHCTENLEREKHRRLQGEDFQKHSENYPKALRSNTELFYNQVEARRTERDDYKRFQENLKHREKYFTIDTTYINPDDQRASDSYLVFERYLMKHNLSPRAFYQSLDSARFARGFKANHLWDKRVEHGIDKWELHERLYRTGLKQLIESLRAQAEREIIAHNLFASEDTNYKREVQKALEIRRHYPPDVRYDPPRDNARYRNGHPYAPSHLIPNPRGELEINVVTPILIYIDGGASHIYPDYVDYVEIETYYDPHTEVTERRVKNPPQTVRDFLHDPREAGAAFTNKLREKLATASNQPLM